MGFLEKIYRAYRPTNSLVWATLCASGLFALGAKPVSAGDYLPPLHYVIIASIKAPDEASKTGSYGGYNFVNEVAKIQSEFRAKCGDVWVWHTDLMDDEKVKWTPSYWFVYAGPTETLAEAKALKNQNKCAAKGYIKRGSMAIPTRYYACSDPKFMSMNEADRQAWCKGW